MLVIIGLIIVVIGISLLVKCSGGKKAIGFGLIGGVILANGSLNERCLETMLGVTAIIIALIWFTIAPRNENDSASQDLMVEQPKKEYIPTEPKQVNKAVEVKQVNKAVEAKQVNKAIEPKQENKITDPIMPSSVKLTVEEPDDEGFVDYKDFFIHSQVQNCNHGLQPVKARMPILRRGRVEQVEFDAGYCRVCGVYYISSSTYNYISSQGRLLCPLMSLQEYRDYKSSLHHADLKPQSILKMIGYNVNAQENLSDTERRIILKYAIESGFITKKRTSDYLKMFINRNERRKNLQAAVSKWKSDLAWLNGYESSGDIVYGVKRIIQ